MKNFLPRVSTEAAQAMSTGELWAERINIYIYSAELVRHHYSHNN